MKHLHLIVRPPPRSHLVANDAERCEYAAGLLSIGARAEALRILQEINPVKTPQTLLYSSSAHFQHWNYEAAIPLLRRYIASALLSPYQVLVENSILRRPMWARGPRTTPNRFS